MNYQYSYLIGDLFFLGVWLVLYLWRKDVRREMWVMSFIFGIAGPIAGFFYTTDWWHPLTITNTKIGIEDFLFGFAVGGIAGVIYEEVFKKRFRKRKSRVDKTHRIIKYALPLFLITAIYFFCVYALKMSTFNASIPALLISSLVIWISRKDLIIDSLVSGALLTLVSLPGYLIPESIFPGFIAHSWYLENLSGILILGVPIEDTVWVFLVGIFIGPMYEYWIEAILVKMGKKRKIKKLPKTWK